MIAGPIAHYHTNSRYYSAVRPRVPQSLVDRQLPHVTIQMPVFKESLEAVLCVSFFPFQHFTNMETVYSEPSIRSLKKAMQTYARQGGTCALFVCDDGLRVLPPAVRDARLAFYATHNIGWVARPPHDPSGSGFSRAGRFKKASNMNYALALSLKMERHLEALIEAQRGMARSSGSAAPAPANDRPAGGPETGGYGIQYQNREGTDSVVWGRADTGGLADDDLEERALGLAIEEVWEESGRKWRPWAANGRATRVGEIVLIVDADTVVPEDCIRDAAREMALSPEVAIIQHESGALLLQSALWRRLTDCSDRCNAGRAPLFRERYRVFHSEDQSLHFDMCVQSSFCLYAPTDWTKSVRKRRGRSVHGSQRVPSLACDSGCRVHRPRRWQGKDMVRVKCIRRLRYGFEADVEGVHRTVRRIDLFCWLPSDCRFFCAAGRRTQRANSRRECLSAQTMS